MKNNAKIKIRSIQNNDDGDIIELVCDGGFYKKNDKWYIFYDEKEEMGMANCSVIIKIDDEKTVVTRKGDFYSKMVYKPGASNEFLYNTPYGAMSMVTKTHKILCSLNDGGGILEIEYSIDFQGESSINNLRVTVEQYAEK